MPKTLCEYEYRTRFLPRLCVATENIGGRGGECEEAAFLNSLHGHIRSDTKGASAIGPQLWGEVVWTGGRGPKSPILLGHFGPLSYGARSFNCCIEKGWGLGHFSSKFVPTFCAELSEVDVVMSS
jgi:hypothetical protein